MGRAASKLFLAAALCAAVQFHGHCRAGEDSAAAEAVFKASGLRAGFCVHLGATDGRLTAALAGGLLRHKASETSEAAAQEVGGRFVVHGLAADAAALEKARGHIRSLGLYGPVSVDRGAFAPLPYADNLVNLLVVDDCAGAAGRNLDLKEVLRVLAPGGTACFAGAAGRPDPAGLAAAGFSAVRAAGAWTVAVKPRPAEMDEWTHLRHSPAGTATSRDTLVGPPRTLRWVDAPHVARHHGHRNPAAAVTAGGRLYLALDCAPPYKQVAAETRLQARDAFSGVVLWEKPVAVREMKGRGTAYPGGSVAARGNVLYAQLDTGGPLLALDGRTGGVAREYPGTSPDATLLVGERLLLLERDRVRLLKAADGAVLWTATVGSYDNRMLCAEGRVFCLVPRMKKVICLDLDSGRQLWAKAGEQLSKDGSAMTGCIAGALVLCTGRSVWALSVKDGAELWSHRYTLSGRAPVAWSAFFSGGRVWVHDVGGEEERQQFWVGLDPATGQVAARHPVSFESKCAPGKATDRYLISGRMHFTDARSGETANTWVARAPCGVGAVPANGMIYSFPLDCQCFTMLSGVMGYGPEPGPARQPASAPERFERGTAAPAPAGRDAGARDWPTYRQDPGRGSATASDPPPAVRRLWTRELGGRLTPPTAADGKVFIASVEDHQVHALDAGDGKTLWSFAAGGRVTAPPTYHKGLVLFGSRDGWAYCLGAGDGRLVWRFRAAPFDRRMISHGQPESACPVEGGVTVVDGRAYVSAGRHSGLGGGVTVYALDAATGALIWEGAPARPAFADLLVLDGANICMRTERFNLVTGKAPARKEAELPPRFWSGRISPFSQGIYAPRTQWQLMLDQGPAKPGADRPGPALSPLVAFDAERAVGFKAYEDPKYYVFKPGEDAYRLWLHRKGQAAPWETDLPIEPRGMVLTPGNVFLAGPRNAWPQKGAELRCHAAADGRELSRLELASTPVFDGLISAGDRLYLATADGRLSCYGK
jgi:outer membrane protein assembly factor BamB